MRVMNREEKAGPQEPEAPKEGAAALDRGVVALLARIERELAFEDEVLVRALRNGSLL